MPSVGHLLINDALPPDYKVEGAVNNKALHKSMARLARENPALYVDTITQLKRRGDEIATLEGISVGLDDIRPLYAERNRVVEEASRRFFGTHDQKERVQAIVDAQVKLLDQTKTHPSSMTGMATFGARGNLAQLMKIVATPLASQVPGKAITPWLITRSYSEGLRPADYWVAAPEARANNIATTVATSEPGEMAKLLVANLTTHVITKTDCGTRSGIRMKLDDPHLIDRHLAGDQQGFPHDTLLTPRLVADLQTRNGPGWLLVRSPMTCAAHPGVCQKCWGLDEKGQLPRIGVNIGVRTAQAMAEPLTQMALGSKHATLMIKQKTLVPTGFKGVRQILEIPAIFQGEAVLAPRDGVVEQVEAAPQGGHYIHFTGVKKPLYAGPQLAVTARPGTAVEAGDALTDGMPRPDHVTKYKGLGLGRQYLAEAIHRAYAADGLDLDKRHFELLGKALLNNVRFVDHDPHHPEFIKGDVVAYNTLFDAYSKDADEVPVQAAVGRPLAREVHHLTAGTVITPSLAKDLKAHGVTTVSVSRHMPHIEPIHKSFVQNPLMDPDWMGRLAHRYLKQSISEAVHTGMESDIHGYHPAAAYAFGAEFGEGPGGTY
jgi:DNA-directed RNA polymerase subunit beta'